LTERFCFLKVLIEFESSSHGLLTLPDEVDGGGVDVAGQVCQAAKKEEAVGGPSKPVKVIRVREIHHVI